MSTLTLAAAGLRGHARRLGATALAIMLSVAFVATTMLALDALERGVAETVAGEVANADLVLQSFDGSIGAAEVDALRGTNGLSVVGAPAQVYGSVGTSGVLVTTPPQGPGVKLLSGSMPSEPGQVAAASTTDYAVGDTLSLELYGTDGTPLPAQTLEVVGLMDVGNAPQFAWDDVLVAPESALRDWDPTLTYPMVSIDLAGVDEAAGRLLLADVAPGARVQTGPEAAAELVTMATGGLDLLGPVLLGFGAIAVATSALVIANTFAIVLAQRTRELALLRCVGATRSQVRRTVLIEALVLGAVAATLGVLLAVAITWAAASALGEVNLGTPITLRPGWDPVSLLLPWVVGVAVTLGAAWWPTRRATRVAPMAALQPAAVPVAASRPGLVRVAASVLLLGAGAAGLVLASSSHDILLGVASGLLSFIGVLVAAVFFVPAGIRALGAALRGVPGRLAVGNTVANPGRAAATSAALLIGVTLITMTSVGAASAEKTAMSEIDQNYPADVMVFPMFSNGPQDDSLAVQPLGQAETNRVSDLSGVAELAQIPAGWLSIEAPDGTWSWDSPVYGIDAASVAPVLRDPGAADTLQPGTVGASESFLEMNGIAPGDTVRLTGPTGNSTATVVTFSMDQFALPAADLAALDASSAGGGALMIRLADDTDVAETVGQIRDIMESQGAWVTGSASERAQLTTVLDLLVLITSALLGVAVVIAVVGIANTLALSVLERARESALLRALGLTRSQLRGMLTIEGMLLAAVSAVLGIALGVAYAWFGVQTLMPEGTQTELAFPLARLALILGLALAAGLLASVLPARRAATIAPAAGLAAV